VIKALIVAAAACCVASAALAQADYPTRPVRVIVPFAAGGGTDGLSRVLADALSRDLGKSFVIENVGGAGGTIGVNQVARAAPDGYTLLCATPSITVNPYLQKNVSYNPVRDFAPIIQATVSPGVLVVNKESPVKTVQDVIDMAKARDVQYGTAGMGSFAHVSTQLFATMTNTKMTHVPYRGTGPAVIDLIAGRLQLQIENAPGILGQVKDGELKAIAVGTPKKSSILPDLPTIAETVPGYEASSWFGILAPAGTPKPIIDKLNAAFNKALNDPAVQKKLTELGVERVGGTPEQFGDYLKAKVKEMEQLAKAANLQPQ
jgi:tripartite-type tricarboxylate transporter receptor subunit TctC